jgi:hypothetical protein
MPFPQSHRVCPECLKGNLQPRHESKYDQLGTQQFTEHSTSSHPHDQPYFQLQAHGDTYQTPTKWQQLICKRKPQSKWGIH